MILDVFKEIQDVRSRTTPVKVTTYGKEVELTIRMLDPIENIRISTMMARKQKNIGNVTDLDLAEAMLCAIASSAVEIAELSVEILAGVLNWPMTDVAENVDYARLEFVKNFFDAHSMNALYVAIVQHTGDMMDEQSDEAAEVADTVKN